METLLVTRCAECGGSYQLADLVVDESRREPRLICVGCRDEAYDTAALKGYVVPRRRF